MRRAQSLAQLLAAVASDANGDGLEALPPAHPRSLADAPGPRSPGGAPTCGRGAADASHRQTSKGGARETEIAFRTLCSRQGTAAL